MNRIKLDMGYFITNVPVPALDEELLVWVKQEDGLDGPTPHQESAIEYISNMQLTAEIVESLRCYYLEKYYDRVDIPIDETRIMDFCSLVMAFVPVHKTSTDCSCYSVLGAIGIPSTA